jgi:hypothetical protein
MTTTLLRRVLLAALLWATLVVTAADVAAADEVLDLIQSINPTVSAAELPVPDWKVTESVLGKQRQIDLVPREAARIVQADNVYYVAEKGTTRWLVGAPAENREIRCEHAFDSLDAMMQAVKFAELPKPPEGLALREVTRLPAGPTRIASDGKGQTLYVLCVNGDVWRIDLKSGKSAPLIRSESYIDLKQGEERVCCGMTLTPDGRLYLVCNQKLTTTSPFTNQVTIFRTAPRGDGDPADPKPWLRAAYPWGIGPFNHGVDHIALGPDGMLYVNSGSRTDANQPGDDDRYWKGGEHELTSCIWRLDPKADEPKIGIYARGLRNAYGFCWDPQGRMFATDNGPDKDPAEELNLVQQGKHYGFPYKFSNWSEKPYPTTPDAPPGLTFVPPVLNLGPDGAMGDGKPLATFTPHSSPSGIVYLDDDWPEQYRGGFFVARFGNLVPKDKDCGFDLLHMRIGASGAGMLTARTRTVLAPIARPVDIHLSGKGKLYICEYSRQITNAGFSGMLPGRVLELAVK